MSDGVLDCLADGDAEAAGTIGILGLHLLPVLCLVAGAGEDGGAIGLHHEPPIRLLLVAYLDHVDGAIEAKESAGKGEGGSPLACAGLGGEMLGAGFAIVVGLGDGGVRLVAADGTGALV